MAKGECFSHWIILFTVAIESELFAYQELISEKFRSGYYMSKVKMMLQSEKA